MSDPRLAFLEPYRAKWQALEPQERVLLTVAGSALAAFLFYVMLWSHMQSELTRLRVSVPEEKAKLSAMQAQAAQVAQLRARGAALRARSGNILATLEQTATAHGLKPSIVRMEPEGANGARLSLDSVAFDTLLTWLNDLQTQNSIRVESANFEVLAAPGTVKGRLLLRGPAA
jgi:general secretion pathway protein M